MDAVIDSVTLNHLFRKPKKVKCGKRVLYETSLDAYIAEKRLKLAVDPNRALVDEWQATCGPEVVKAAIMKWEATDGVYTVARLGRLTNAHTNKLLQFGFGDAVDKLILRIAVASTNRTVVSNDSDFWNPKAKCDRGKKNACVTRFCRERLNVSVLLLGTLMLLLPTIQKP